MYEWDQGLEAVWRTGGGHNAAEETGVKSTSTRGLVG